MNSTSELVNKAKVNQNIQVYLRVRFVSMKYLHF